MSLALAGMGWITPLGRDLNGVWNRLLAGELPRAELVSSEGHQRTYPVFRIPPEVSQQTPAHPRLRRASAISRFAAAAGLSALENAGITLDEKSAERTALIFAIANGGVIYTRRFYHDIVATGAQAASPLLFPETVFNAPASHLAAILGLTGATYTLVGDAAVGVLAVKMAEDLLQNPALDRCLIVGAEEADWLLCDAYRRWRLLRAAPPIEPFARPPRGTILSEGAGAILLERAGSTAQDTILLEQIESGGAFFRQSEAAARVQEIFAHLHACDDDLVVASANGTFIDQAEDAAIRRECPAAIVFAPKMALGESAGSSAIWQIICAALALRSGHASLPAAKPRLFRRAIVSSCGLNQQAAGLSLRLHLVIEGKVPLLPFATPPHGSSFGIPDARAHFLTFCSRFHRRPGAIGGPSGARETAD